MSKVLFVRHIPLCLSEESLREFFSYFGSQSIKILKGRMRGCAILTFLDHETALRAFYALNNFKLLDKELRVVWDKHDKENENDSETKVQLDKPTLLAQNLGLDYPPPPYLEYKYPPPNPSIIQNISKTLYNVPKFYEQVLHLMNKMNLPPPFEGVPVNKKNKAVKKPKTQKKEDLYIETQNVKRMKTDDRRPIEIEHKIETISIKKPTIALPSVIEPISTSTINSEIEYVKGEKASVKSSSEVIKEWKVISEEELESKRLTLQQIIEIPKFSNYDAGVPTSKLYIKNLTKHTTEDDLKYIYGIFFESEEDMKNNLEINLMKSGRLKGQAFLKFKSIEMAQKALLKTNGYILHDKPMIVFKMSEVDRLINPSDGRYTTKIIIDFERPYKKFMLNFPKGLDQKLSRMDDFFIRIFQKPSNAFITLLSKIITLIVSIEIIICASFGLFMLGLDSFGTEILLFALITATLSQIPKRFIWRRRPWMESRARKRANAYSSSFPSRPNACGIVYVRILTMVLFVYLGDEYFFKWWYILIYIGFSFIILFSRINLGGHYMSDCIGGIILGCIIIFVQFGFMSLVRRVCGDCTKYECYVDPAINPDRIIDYLHIKRVNFKTSIILFLSSIIVGILFIIKPIEFWKKFSKSYGLLLPSLCFRLLFLCTGIKRTKTSLPKPHDPQWYIYIYSILVPVISILVASKIAKRLSLLVYIILSILLMTILVVWRLFMI